MANDTLCRLYLWGNSPGAHCTEGWVGSRAGLDGWWNSRLPHRDFEPRTVQPVASCYTEQNKSMIHIKKYRVTKKDGLNWTVNGASTHARQLFAVFPVLCSLYGLTWRGLRSKLSWIRLTFSSDTRKKILCCIVAILLSTDAAARLYARRAL